MENGMSYDLSDEVLHGINLINHGEYFEAHEILESAWGKETRAPRRMLQGLIQVSVMLHHLERENLNGAAKLAQRSLANLRPFKELQTPLDISRLIEDVASLSARIQAGETAEKLKYLVNTFRVSMEPTHP